MIPRILSRELRTLLKEYPVVTVLGPRQAGKTTLVRDLLSGYEYVNLEVPNTRRLAHDDPVAFVRKHQGKIIFDEIQRAPVLLSYLQAIVDENQVNGQFVLTGSHQLELRAAIAQSLAGRTAIVHLLPLSIAELAAAGVHYEAFEEYVFQGFLPRIHAERQRPHTAWSNYYQTYVERDVRQLVRLKDASLFEKFMKLLAGRVGQLINFQSLAADVGVDAKTIREWLSILEASFLVFKLPPYFENFGKRVIKSPKFYFTDTGLLAFLLGIENAGQVSRDPLVGHLFENLVMLEALKARYNSGRVANLYFYRDSHGSEIDLLWSSGRELAGLEIKSAATWNPSFKKTLLRFSDRQHSLRRMHVIYSGEPLAFSDGVEAVNYHDTASLFSLPAATD